MTHVRLPRLALASFAGLAFAIGACSSAPPTAAPGGATPSLPPAGSAEPTGAASDAPASVDPGSAGGDGSEFCLNTVEEVSAALEVDVTTAQGGEAPGVGGGCGYTTADGTMVYAISVVNNEAAAAAFEASKSTQGAVTISGIGDEAVLVSEVGPLAVRVGDVVISLGPVIGDPGTIDTAAMRAAMEELGRSAAGRL